MMLHAVADFDDRLRDAVTASRAGRAGNIVEWRERAGMKDEPGQPITVCWHLKPGSGHEAITICHDGCTLLVGVRPDVGLRGECRRLRGVLEEIDQTVCGTGRHSIAMGRVHRAVAGREDP